MTEVISKMLRVLTIPGSGRWCRRCGGSIVRNDSFGQSEGVCHPCRGDSA